MALKIRTLSLKKNSDVLIKKRACITESVSYNVNISQFLAVAQNFHMGRHRRTSKINQISYLDAHTHYTQVHNSINHINGWYIHLSIT